ncbi:MAG: DUF503 domain-containing protein [Gemmataceae bacterium]|nr:DUF503 domain-containing protein [Gemmataceae bacterium]
MNDLQVGCIRVRLLVRESHSLKDKRQVLKSIKDLLRNRFNVAVAEVDHQENRQLIVLGIASVSNQASHLKATFDEVARFLRNHPVAEFIDCQMEY